MDITSDILLGAGIVGILGIVGVAFAVVQWRDRNAARIPRLTFRTPDGIIRDQQGRLRLTVVNAGGQAGVFLVALHAGTDFYYYVGSLGSNSQGDFDESPVASATNAMSTAIPVAIAACDAGRRWWNSLGAPSRITEPINEWLSTRCSHYGHGCPELTPPPCR